MRLTSCRLFFLTALRAFSERQKQAASRRPAGANRWELSIADMSATILNQIRVRSGSFGFGGRNRKIGFCAAALLVAALFVTPAAAQHSFLSKPDIHGDRVVFTAEGDLWLGSISRQVATRITTDPGLETDAHFSPDGKTIAFTAQYDGGSDLYTMPASGGEPRRITYEPNAVTTIGWTPDGKSVLFRTFSQSPWWSNKLYLVAASGGQPQMLPVPEAQFAALNSNGHTLAYVPVSADWQHWFRYHGGQADDIWLTDIAKPHFTRLTTYRGIDTTPVWVGNDIYFISERDGYLNLYRMDASGKSVAQLTHYTDYSLRYPSTDGKRIIFQHGHGLALYDPALNTTKELVFHLRSDRIHARVRRVALSSAVVRASIGPTGKRVVVEARGQIVSAPVKHGEFVTLAPMPGSRSQYPAWSPDGKWIAFVSDRTGEEQLWVCRASGDGEPRQLTKDHKGPLG
ncbi:MAG TPA: hypothetical protein VGS41_03170, partial [Chthonomonadales bacterium]|nr:hypothetical protein [Chthonomonadales bacterium]